MAREHQLGILGRSPTREHPYVAVVALVPVDAEAYRCEFVTATPVAPGAPIPSGAWRVEIDNVWLPMNKAPQPRGDRRDDWASLLAPHVRGAIRRRQEGKP